MKHTELKQLIKEEIRSVLNEGNDIRKAIEYLRDKLLPVFDKNGIKMVKHEINHDKLDMYFENKENWKTVLKSLEKRFPNYNPKPFKVPNSEKEWAISIDSQSNPYYRVIIRPYDYEGSTH